MYTPMNILKNEFGYSEEVDPIAGDQWDLIFGGYPHCGEKRNDWKMETGLNKLLTEQGWDKLRPHQVWFPCMGCNGSYCNKRDLCLIMKEIDPDYCFSLPDDRSRLVENMRRGQVEGEKLQKKQLMWVLKEDHPDKHLHVGSGVHFIKSEMELPNVQDQSSGAYLVQPFVEHKMANIGVYQQRRHELQMFLTVTSTTPLRAYAYTVTGKFANARIDDTDPLQPCSVDTHNAMQKKLGCHINKTFSECKYLRSFLCSICKLMHKNLHAHSCQLVRLKTFQIIWALQNLRSGYFFQGHINSWERYYFMLNPRSKGIQSTKVFQKVEHRAFHFFALILQ